MENEVLLSLMKLGLVHNLKIHLKCHFQKYAKFFYVTNSPLYIQKQNLHLEKVINFYLIHDQIKKIFYQTYTDKFFFSKIMPKVIAPFEYLIISKR